MKLVEEYKFPSLFINQYFPRPGTPAAKLPRIDTQEVSYRYSGTFLENYENKIKISHSQWKIDFEKKIFNLMILECDT